MQKPWESDHPFFNLEADRIRSLFSVNRVVDRSNAGISAG